MCELSVPSYVIDLVVAHPPHRLTQVVYPSSMADDGVPDDNESLYEYVSRHSLCCRAPLVCLAHPAPISLSPPYSDLRISSGCTDSFFFHQYLDMPALLSVLPHRSMHRLHDTVTLLHSRHPGGLVAAVQPLRCRRQPYCLPVLCGSMALEFWNEHSRRKRRLTLPKPCRCSKTLMGPSTPHTSLSSMHW